MSASETDDGPEGRIEETSEQMQTAAADTIVRWLHQERPDLSVFPADSKLIVYFLRTAKYNVDKTKRKLLMYLQNRETLVEWFTARDPFRPEVQQLLDIGVFLPLRHKDRYNRQVVVIRIAAHDPKQHKQDNVFKVDKMILDLLLHLDEGISHHGLVAIFDMKNVALGHALQMTPSIIKKAVNNWENYPCRPQLLEFVHAPLHVSVILNVFRKFMSPKMKSRVIVSSKESVMAKLVTLPPELGGSGDNYDELTVHWKRKVEQNVELYARMEQNVLML